MEIPSEKLTASGDIMAHFISKKMEQDHLSNLPKIILHDILSRLPEEDAIRTSVLSKTWAQTWYTFPILSFSDLKYVGSMRMRVHELVRSNNITTFVDYVGRTLLRFRNHGLAIKQFKLRILFFDLYQMTKDVDLWLKLAIESGAEVLEFLTLFCVREQHYIFPTGILEANSLTKLVLKGRIKIDLSLINHSIKFFSLQVLELDHVLLEDVQSLEHFIFRCPLIESITLSWCECHKGCLRKLESVSMCGLPKLKRVYVRGIREVYVDSPCLENFHYSPCNQPPEKMEISKCKNLRELHITYFSNTIITNKWFCELFANFPFLESLTLIGCVMSRRIFISSVQLKVLELIHCLRLKEFIIDAPNLLSCRYVDERRAIKSLSFLRCSSQLKVNVGIYNHFVDFSYLREFIQNFTPKFALESVSLSILDSRYPLNPVVAQVSSVPPNIKHLVIRDVPTHEAMFLPVVYDLLSSCCPTTISINTNFVGLIESYKLFIKFFYETLKGEIVDNCFWNCSNSKCWWHDLKNVKVTNSLNTDENVDFKTMLDALSSNSIVYDCIIFRLEF